jgi:hypothetical protein
MNVGLRIVRLFRPRHAGAFGLSRKPQSHSGNPMKLLSRIAPWLARIALAAAALILAMIALKFIGDPVGAAAASQIHLGSALAMTNMRASFGAFPLGCALVAAGSLASSRFHLSGLVTVATVIGSALVVRLGGVLSDGTFAQSRTVLSAEAGLFLLSLLAMIAQLSRRAALKTA